MHVSRVGLQRGYVEGAQRRVKTRGRRQVGWGQEGAAGGGEPRPPVAPPCSTQVGGTERPGWRLKQGEVGGAGEE